MDDIAFIGAQKRIDFLGRQSLAFFTAFAVLSSWLGARYEAEMYGIVFWLGAAGLVIVAVFWLVCGVAAYISIKRLEAHKNVRI